MDGSIERFIVDSGKQDLFKGKMCLWNFFLEGNKKGKAWNIKKLVSLLLELNFSKSHDLQNVNHNMLRAHWCGNFNQSLCKASPWERAATWYFLP